MPTSEVESPGPGVSVRPLWVEVITLFPGMIEGPCHDSILGRAQQQGLLQVRTRDLRPYGLGKHRIVDDTPYGGGAGMVMRPEPLVTAIEESRAAWESVRRPDQSHARVLLLDPQGEPFRQPVAQRLAVGDDALILVCGRYEGVDERVRAFVDGMLCVADVVLTGGEFAALCVIDAVARLRPGVLGNETSAKTESFADDLLEGPQYTRPVDFRGMRVPDVLVSGHHARVAEWRRAQAVERTRIQRPDLLDRSKPS